MRIDIPHFGIFTREPTRVVSSPIHFVETSAHQLDRVRHVREYIRREVIFSENPKLTQQRQIRIYNGIASLYGNHSPIDIDVSLLSQIRGILREHDEKGARITRQDIADTDRRLRQLFEASE